MTTLTKNTDIDWIGKIPTHWEVKRVKEFYKLGMGQTILKEDLIDDGKYPVYSATAEDKFFGYVNKINNPLNIGDLVIPARGNSIGHVKLVKETAVCTQTTIYMKQRSKIDSNFVYYYLLGNKPQLFFFDDTAIPQITVEQINGRLILVPSLHEQKAIANYLDQETSQIDRKISILEQKLEKLEEYKQAVIFETVTKGLDSNVPMKDSGIDWIGKIPAHWTILRLKECSIIKKGEKFNEELSSPEGVYPYINGGINPSDWSNTFNTKENTIAVSEGGASAGYTQFMKTKYWAGSHCYKIQSKNKNSDNKYLFYVLKGFEKYLMIEKTGSAMPNLQKTKFINYLVSFVNEIEEQNKIVNFLDTETFKIDKKKEIIKKQIELLKEYKQSIIYEAVTGKMEIL